jgi:predicted TIM-barrel fold metal-dependent hydrolase
VAVTPVEITDQQPDPTRFRLVDCDVHPLFPDGLNSLAPFMTKSWARKLGLEEKADWIKGMPNMGAFSIPTNGIYTSLDGSLQMEAIPEDGRTPASAPDLIIDGLLEPLGIDRAVLVQGNIFGLGGIPNAHIATTIAAASNDWVHDLWITADERFRYAIVAAPQDPVASAAEIRRCAARKGAVQVFMPSNRKLMGDPFLYPIYEAAAECGLPVSVHPTAIESMFVNGPQSSGEPPWYYIEWRATLSLPHQANAASLIAHGVFERFPELKIIFSEVGLVWLLELMWHMDKDWKGLRDETPWIKRPPSEYMLEHFRFTTQPFVEPKKREHLLQLLDMMQGDKILLFSSDYPHWDGDDPRWVLQPLPEPLRERIGVQNAVELYGDRLL